jgi:hypothetical protein
LNVVVDGWEKDNGVTASHVGDDLGGGLFDWHDVQETLKEKGCHASLFVVLSSALLYLDPGEGLFIFLKYK